MLESEEISPGVVVDYDESNEVVAIEILNLSERSAELEISSLQIKAAG